MAAGQKIVINVDNAPDKTFEFDDKDVAVKLAKGLKVGDPVAVTEHSVLGKTNPYRSRNIRAAVSLRVTQAGDKVRLKR